MHSEKVGDRKPMSVHLTPFKRGRSKVFYDSDSDHQSRLLAASHNQAYLPNQYVNCAYITTRESDDTSADSKSDEYGGQTNRTVGQFWPESFEESASYTPLRCSPSQRSQDSGYSDSGESNNGNHATSEPTETPSPPVVKHVTRVYFGQQSKSPPDIAASAIARREIPPKIPQSCPAPTRTYKVCRRRLDKSPSTHRHHVRRHKSHILEDRCWSIGASTTQLTPTTQQNSLSTEELDEYLEHKPLFAGSSTGIPQHKNGMRKLFHSLISDWKPNVGFSRKITESQKLNNSLPIQSSSVYHVKPTVSPRRWSGSDFNRCSTPILAKDIHYSSSCCSSTNPAKSSTIQSISSRPAELHNPTQLAYGIANSLGNESLHQWLHELRGSSEIECMNTLQSKTISVGTEHKSSQIAIKSIQTQSHVISTQFAFLCQKLESIQLEEMPSIVKTLVEYIEQFVNVHCLIRSSKIDDKCVMPRQVKVLDQICNKLEDICTEAVISGEVSCSSIKTIYENVEDESDFTVDHGFVREVVQVVTALGHAFTKLVDILLCHEVKELVKKIEDTEGNDKLHDTISQITSLSVDGGHVCRIVCRMGGIRSLLGLCVLPKHRRQLSQSLRAIATICCVPEGISHFEQEGGVEIIADILCNYSNSEEDRSEAAGVLAQTTSPWVEDSLSFPCLRTYLKPIVDALNTLTKETSSTDVFLLSSAALANLTFLDTKCIEALISTRSYDILLQKTKHNENLSIYIKDQVATVLANISGSPRGAKAIKEAGGIAVLVSLIKTDPSFSSHIPELSAVEHVQQKAAIAISRLCSDVGVGRLLLKLGGAARLVELCKNSEERNGSDAVLVACLAALRKLASACGEDEVRKVDGAELIEPRLLDSFLTYSSQQENYV